MEVYSSLEFPAAPPERPYVFINMVATIDGKTVIGNRDEDVEGLGSRVDRLLVRRIEQAADAVLVGGQTLRATSLRWNPASPKRIAVTNSGEVPHDAQFFTGGTSFLATSEESKVTKFDQTKLIRCGSDRVDFCALLRILRTEHDVERLVVMGGSELNAELLKEDLVDELFLTVAPKIKLGRGIPTYAGGEPLSRSEILDYSLAEHHAVGDEVFLRYRRNKR